MSDPSILDLVNGDAPLPKIDAGSPQGVTVTQWTVSYDSAGRLTATCLVRPDAGVDISLCAIVLYTQDFATIIAYGGGGLNDNTQPGVGSLWGATTITQVYPQGKGTTVACRILGFSTYGAPPNLFLFDRTFTI